MAQDSLVQRRAAGEGCSPRRKQSRPRHPKQGSRRYTTSPSTLCVRLRLSAACREYLAEAKRKWACADAMQVSVKSVTPHIMAEPTVSVNKGARTCTRSATCCVSLLPPPSPSRVSVAQAGDAGGGRKHSLSLLPSRRKAASQPGLPASQ
ncbi:uncharacterized protein B0I36DRAFT_39045 [Microdochium trichocladiopsis]|uniref:Uncharacterized protein n=1 Tax=Microdochium trichocladiopsis TaxID=1682393 RepID=A0A9P8XUL4_9PEZI|nr:uncharacterized protein B0I36DRAFT_39045 [Microdochium trichocladiopsis]KAH7018414.1 hypothetical protein B0I36DRAFT_39045 [Microdochium trichocladiopsis]